MKIREIEGIIIKEGHFGIKGRDDKGKGRWEVT